MQPGKALRLSRILRQNGRTVIAAIDHGIAGIQPLAGLTSPGILLEQLASAEIDAVLTTPGIVSAFASQLRHIGLIVRVDGGPTAQTGRWEEMRLALRAEDALRLGADGVAAMGIVGAEGESASLRGLERLAARCHEWGLVLLAEMLPGGFAANEVSVEQIAVAARLGAEVGADLIKIRYGGTVDTYKDVISGCYRPVVVLGGSRQSPEQLLAQVQDTLKAGAAGVAIGRNIWQAPEPYSIAKQLVEAVHGDGN